MGHLVKTINDRNKKTHLNQFLTIYDFSKMIISIGLKHKWVFGQHN